MLPRALKARKKNNIKIKEEYYVYPNKEFNNLKLSEKQQVIMDVFLSKKKELYSELNKINTAVDTLIKKNILTRYANQKIATLHVSKILICVRYKQVLFL